MSEENIIKTAISKATLQEALVCVMEWEIHRAVKQALNNSDPTKPRIETHHDGALYDTCSTTLVSSVVDGWNKQNTASFGNDETLTDARDMVDKLECLLRLFVLENQQLGFIKILYSDGKSTLGYGIPKSQSITHNTELVKVVLDFVENEFCDFEHAEVTITKINNIKWEFTCFVDGVTTTRDFYTNLDIRASVYSGVLTYITDRLVYTSLQPYLSFKHMDGVKADKLKEDAAHDIDVLEALIGVYQYLSTKLLKEYNVVFSDDSERIILNRLKDIHDLKRSFGISTELVRPNPIRDHIQQHGDLHEKEPPVGILNVFNGKHEFCLPVGVSDVSNHYD